jgi:hypothetical protein
MWAVTALTPFQLLAADFLKALIPKSGVREYENEQVCAAAVLTACRMASGVLTYEEEVIDMAREMYVNEAATILIGGGVGADYAFSFEGVANGAGRICTQIDLGAPPRPPTLKWRASYKCQATPTAGNEVRFRKAGSDGTYNDGGLGTSDAALATEPTYNVPQFGAVKVQAAGTQANVYGGEFDHSDQYLSIVGWNATGATIDATATNFFLSITPIFYQQQA